MKQLSEHFPVRVLCQALDVAPSSYYYHSHRADDLDLREAIEAVTLEYPRYGYRRVHAELERQGWHVNRKRVQRLMQAANLLVEVRRYCQTTNSSHGYGRHPNLIKHLEIVRPDQVWAADLTYIRLERQFVYLAVLLDLFTRSIRGWELAGHMTEELPKMALLRACRPNDQGFITRIKECSMRRLGTFMF